jgi:ABC-type phosphate/phosphonate transport system substrate-binding protein
MIASLPLHDGPRLRPVWDQLWLTLRDALRREGIDAPEALSWPSDLPAHWRRPDLVLSQARALEVATRLRDVLQPVAAWTFELNGAGRGTQRSCVIVREDHAADSIDDVLGLRLAASDPFSWSGAGCLRAAFGHLEDAFATVRFLGSERASCAAVRHGTADVAVVDVITWASLGPGRDGLRVLGLTASAPAPPLVVPVAADPAPVLRALGATFQSPASAEARGALRLKGYEPVSQATYRDLAPFGPPAATVR